MIADRPAMSGMDRMCSWIFGAKRSIPMIWVTRARVNALTTCDLSLICRLAGLKEGLPLDGLAQEFDDPGRPGILGRFRLAPAWQDGAHDPVGGHTARQGADVAVLEGPFGPEGDLHYLFAVGGYGRAALAVQGDVDDAEPDLGLGPSPAASNTVTFGEPFF